MIKLYPLTQTYYYYTEQNINLFRTCFETTWFCDICQLQHNEPNVDKIHKWDTVSVAIYNKLDLLQEVVESTFNATSRITMCVKCNTQCRILRIVLVHPSILHVAFASKNLQTTIPPSQIPLELIVNDMIYDLVGAIYFGGGHFIALQPYHQDSAQIRVYPEPELSP